MKYRVYFNGYMDIEAGNPSNAEDEALEELSQLEQEGDFKITKVEINN